MPNLAPTPLYLARHAETVFNRHRRMQGNEAHTPLTRDGIAQAEAMGAALARLGASELVAPDSWDQAPVDCVPRPNRSFASDEGEVRLKSVHGVSTLDGFGQFTRAMLAAAGGLLTYLDHVGRGSLPLLLPPVAREAGTHMAMDEATRSSLEILVSSNGTRRGSLVEAVDRCVTGAGARLLAEDLSAPLTDARAINRRLELVSWLHDDPLLPSEADLPVDPALDADGKEIHVQVEMPGKRVTLKVWKAKAGHITIYLLDSDLPENDEADRRITYQLYGGDINTRIQQEIVLGIGGVRALAAVGLKPTVWHINEGHAAFQILERCREAVAQGLDFDSALELVAELIALLVDRGDHRPHRHADIDQHRLR